MAGSFNIFHNGNIQRNLIKTPNQFVPIGAFICCRGQGPLLQEIIIVGAVLVRDTVGLSTQLRKLLLQNFHHYLRINTFRCFTSGTNKWPHRFAAFFFRCGQVGFHQLSVIG